MKIIVDAMGGDYAPGAVVEGVVDAVKDLGVKVTLVGRADDIQSELTKYQYPAENISIIHAPDVVDSRDTAVVTLRKKRRSSIAIGVKLLKDKEYGAFISAGNTGAVVAASTVYVGMIAGVERPAIGLVIPTLERFAFLIDVGANTDPKPRHLLQSAQMSVVYARSVLGVDNPRVGLLNIGEEESKGTDFVKEIHRLMSKGINNFIGNIEANEIFSGRCDCIISDGFVGNIVIKISQSLMESAAILLRREIKKSPLAMLGAALLKPRMDHIRRYADYSEYGGAPLLGVNGIVMISHGRSSPKAIKNAIRAAQREIEHKIISRMEKVVQK